MEAGRGDMHVVTSQDLIARRLTHGRAFWTIDEEALDGVGEALDVGERDDDATVTLDELGHASAVEANDRTRRRGRLETGQGERIFS